MTRFELRRWSDVEHQHFAALQSRGELLAIDDVDAITVAEIGSREPLESGDVFTGDIAQRRPQFTDPLAGQRIEDARAVAPRRDQPGPGHGPQMVRRVGHALVDLGGDLLHRPLALSENIDDLGPAPAGQRFGHFCESVEECVLGRSLTHAPHRQPHPPSCQVFK